ncbi:MAG: DUF4384 domain-containing protein [Bacteroides sp.]|nr:DUF4384 domain-containing protein [Bacteroides sp.]
MSVEEAKRIALDRAKIQAIADEFGTIVSQSTSTLVTNKNGQSDTKFFSLGGSDVKGEWIETISEPTYEVGFGEHLLVVTCSVTGKIREVLSKKTDFIAKPLRNGTLLIHESAEFKDGDDLYLYFQSPVAGYLAVYLIDESSDAVFTILPYRNSDGNAYKIAADKEYIFFSQANAEPGQSRFVDEYQLHCADNREFNTLLVVFSTNDFAKVISENDSRDDSPKKTDIPKYKRWATDMLKYDNALSIKEIPISISK